MSKLKTRPRRSFFEWWDSKVRRAKMKRMRCDFVADGLGVTSKNLSFMSEPAFAAAWGKAAQLGLESWESKVPDVRWRAHVAVWCASNALRVTGDFVECGVHTGLLSVTICETLGFANVPKTFWLFDTWSGIPVETLSGKERERATGFNASRFGMDVYALAKRNFEPYPNVKLVRGVLPGTLDDAAIENVAYLSVDLNNAVAERAVIERLWPRISVGGMVLLDDYGFRGFEEQHEMWNGFAQRAGRRILTAPTGQGLLLK